MPYLLDMHKLAEVAKDVRMKSFGDKHRSKFLDYMKSVEAKLIAAGCDMPFRNGVIGNFEMIWDRTLVLMSEGPENYAYNVALDLIKFRQSGLTKPIYPIVNDGCKSDAWLTGLVVSYLTEHGVHLNDKDVGFAISGKPLTERFDKPVLDVFKSGAVFIYIDDASYSGTQASNVWRNLAQSRIAGTQVGASQKFMFLSGLSSHAKELLGSIDGLTVQYEALMPECNKNVFPHLYHKDTRNFLGYTKNIELNPGTLEPKAISSEFPPFVQPLSLAVLPYKIPDSMSVPTHLYAAIGYQSTQATSIPEMSHLFTNNGSTDYRTVIKQRETYFRLS